MIKYNKGLERRQVKTTPKNTGITPRRSGHYSLGLDKAPKKVIPASQEKTQWGAHWMAEECYPFTSVELGGNGLLTSPG